MAGVKQFDEDAVLERAMRLFWARGYEATTISDLLAATRLNRGSLYGAFGDKERLFLTALDRYIGSFGRAMLDELSEPEPRRALEKMFEAIIRRTCDPAFPRGCLMTNTALECRGAGETVNRKVAAMLAAQESAIYQVLRRAQLAGSLAPAQDARALARFFTGVAQGMNVVHKAGADAAVLRDMAAVAMSAWQAPASSPRVKRKRL
jgi:TetR/AcrR family transcriptional regulator, transcriptional repressor for nem operon